MKTFFTVTTLVCLMLIAGIAWSATIRVPSQQPNIQAGINVAVSGADTVLVAPGTYAGAGNINLDFGGKAITVRSQPVSQGGGATTTIIDATGGVGFIFQSGETSTSLVRGFTITNGSGTNGGAIACTNNSSPKIINMIITGNTASGAGGGILCNDSSPDIVGCLIYGNSAGTFGGGVVSSGTGLSSPDIVHCTITGNSAGSGGGGLGCPQGGATVIDSIIWGASSGGDIVIGNGQTVTISFSDYGTQAGLGTLVDAGGMLPVNTDPLFVGGVDYHITDFSPCIGAGLDVSATYPNSTADIDGNPRPNPALTDPDIGYDENFRDVPLAVELSSFTATSNGAKVTLKWRTESEINNLGFKVYRSTELDGDYVKVTPALIMGAGTEATPREYSFTDEDVAMDSTYYYYVEDVDFSGKTNKSDIIKVTVGKQVKSVSIIPRDFALLQNFPNPFNPETWIPYKLAQDALVTVRIYNLKGQLIRTLALGQQTVGTYMTKDKAAYWDGRDDSGEKVASGMYFYTLQAGEFKATKRMIVVE